MQHRAIEAARMYLFRNGYQIVDVNYECEAGTCDIICKDDDQLVFVNVKHRVGKEMPEDNITPEYRSRFETVAINYLADNTDEVEISLRFDIISLAIFNDDYAMLRHFINAFGSK